MAVKRLKNWFFQVTATLTSKGKRFLKYDQPVEDTYRDLIESVPFFLETDDRAKETMQGLVHRATNAEAKAYDETEVTTKTKAVVPSQLPEVVSESDNIVGNPLILPDYTGNAIEVNIATNLTSYPNANKRNIFVIRLSNAFSTWLSDFFNGIITWMQAFRAKFSGGLTGQVLAKASSADEDFTWVDITTLASGIPGGLMGQVLVKNSNANYDYSWMYLPEQIIYEVDSTTSMQFRFYYPYNAILTPIYISSLVTMSPLPPSYTGGTELTFSLSGTGIVVIQVQRV